MCTTPYRWYGINKIEYSGGHVRLNWVEQGTVKVPEKKEKGGE